MQLITARIHGAVQMLGGFTMISVPTLIAAAEPVGSLHAVVGGLQVGAVALAHVLRRASRAYFQDDAEHAESAEWLDAMDDETTQ